ncbi:MAG: amino acid ABC transporter substrate-binding protein [Acidimicrobiales bacterium]
MRGLLSTGCVGVVVAASLATGCSSGGSGGGSSKSPIILGATESLSGKFASSGTNIANGYQLAIDQVNKSGGVLGRQLQLKTQDDQSDPALVGRAYSDFLGKDHVDALLSPYGSPLSGAAAQLSERYKVPMVHSQSASPDIYKGLKYSVMAGLGPANDLMSGVPAFAKAQGYTKIETVNNDLTTYKQQCDGVAAAIPAAGASLVSSLSYAAATSDFSSTALKIKQDDPEVVVECSAIQDTIGLTRALAQQGFRPKMIVSPTAVDATFASSLGPLANHAIAYSVWAASLGLPGSAEFAQSYQDRYKAAANTQSASAFATVQVLVAAIKAAGSLDHDKVNKALHEGNFQTILGKYKVNPDGIQTGYKSLLLENIDGKYQVVWPKGPGSVPAQLPY